MNSIINPQSFIYTYPIRNITENYKLLERNIGQIFLSCDLLFVYHFTATINGSSIRIWYRVCMLAANESNRGNSYEFDCTIRCCIPFIACQHWIRIGEHLRLFCVTCIAYSSWKKMECISNKNLIIWISCIIMSIQYSAWWNEQYSSWGMKYQQMKYP